MATASALQDELASAGMARSTEAQEMSPDWWWGDFIRSPKPRHATLERQRLRSIDLFSSVGGLSLGASVAARNLGYELAPLLAADVDEKALAVYKYNLNPRDTIRASVRDLVDFRVVGSGVEAKFAYAPVVMHDSLEVFRNRVDLLVAGPPCQGHSSLNNYSRHDDPKNLLYLTVPAVALAMGIKNVVIENVPNVVADKHGVVGTTISLFEQAGYHVEYGVLRADDMGWPQTRKRFFLVASLERRPIPMKEIAARFARPAEPVTWLIDDIQDQVSADNADIMMSVPQMTTENRRRVEWLFDNDQHELPNHLRPKCHREGTTYPATYGRMYGDRPAPTLTSGFLTPGRGRFVHPTRPRVLSPREAARIQGFPDWFQFDVFGGKVPTRTELATWIGNAVPSILGHAAVTSVLQGLD